LDYDNVTVYHRDGSAGLPVEAHFEAIIVSARASNVPQTLRSQLGIGGRLVIPVGSHKRQVLRRIIRKAEKVFEEQDIGFVAFVPLVTRESGSGNGSPASRKNPEGVQSALRLPHAKLPRRRGRVSAPIAAAPRCRLRLSKS
jgi:hypothetical protein